LLKACMLSSLSEALFIVIPNWDEWEFYRPRNLLSQNKNVDESLQSSGPLSDR
jgi:hypothetical protein